MVKYHPAAKALYYILCLISAGVFCGIYFYRSSNGLIDPNDSSSIPAAALLTAICVIISAVISSVIAARSVKKELQILDEECDPVKFTEKTSKEYKKACRLTFERRKPDVSGCTILLNHAVAESMNGEYDEAIDISRRLIAADMKAPFIRPLAMLHTAVYLASRGKDGDTAEAKKLVENANSLIDSLSSKIPQATVKALSLESSNAAFRISIADGTDSADCVDFYTKQIDDAHSRRGRLYSRYMLACAYRTLGDIENERAQLETLAADGTDKMKFMRDAAERLAELRQR